jgi:hypothetical protein
MPNFYRPRRKTLTNDMELNHHSRTTTDHLDENSKWGDTPELNNEIEREELILYVQRNSRMTFAGIIEKSSTHEDDLQKLVSQNKLLFVFVVVQSI